MAKRKKEKDKQWSTKHTHKSKDRVTRKPLKTEGLVVSVRFRIFNLRSQQTQTTMYVKHCDYPSKKKYKSVLYPSTVIPLSIRNFSIWNMHTILISSSRRHFLGLMSRGRTSISFILNKTKKEKAKNKKTRIWSTGLNVVILPINWLYCNHVQ